MTTVRHVVALSGPVCGGKTTLAKGLAAHSGTLGISTRRVLLSRPEAAGAVRERRHLQHAGDLLDRATAGAWVADAVCDMLAGEPHYHTIVVDAIRTADQLRALDRAGPVVHVHLTAPESVLRARFTARAADRTGFEPVSYDAVLTGTEVLVACLTECADLVLNTGTLDIGATHETVRRYLELTEPGPRG